jgi:proline iminopeptidase
MRYYSIKESYKKGYFSVGQGHKIYYERYGNPKGIPAVFIHGGPGSHFQEKHKRMFNPKVFDVLFFDQRGAGKSKPIGELRNNTTTHLVNDINLLLDKFHIDKALIVGGSWGSTLALVYAIRNPKRVTGLALRGVFLGTKEEERHVFGGGVESFVPEEWKRFIELVPKEHRNNPIKYCWLQIKSSDKKKRDLYIKEMHYFESSLMALRDSKAKTKAKFKDWKFSKDMLVYPYYMIESCFLPDKYIENNLDKLKGIPTYIVQGKYDLVCPPIGAYKVHKGIPKSILKLVVESHSISEPEGKQTVITQMKWFEKKLK